MTSLFGPLVEGYGVFCQLSIAAGLTGGIAGCHAWLW